MHTHTHTHTHTHQDWSEDPETGKVEQQNELFAFRFANPENAAKFKEAFEKCQKGASDDMPVIKQDAEDAEKVRASSCRDDIACRGEGSARGSYGCCCRRQKRREREEGGEGEGEREIRCTRGKLQLLLQRAASKKRACPSSPYTCVDGDRHHSSLGVVC